MNVWSHTIYDWDEIVVLNELGDAWGPESSETIVAGLSIDYLCFQSESLQNLFTMERQSSRSTILKRLQLLTSTVCQTI